MSFLNNKKLFSTVVVLVFLIFCYKGIVSLDPDFGWHIRLGQLISSNGLFATDPFSYTMPSFPYIDHEWLTNIFLANGFRVLGKPGLAIFYSILALLSLFLSLNTSYSSKVKKTKLDPLFYSMLFIVGAGVLFPFFGIRPQVQSWLLFSIFVDLILNEKLKTKLFFLLPLLTFIWVNLHGSFALGLVAIFLTVILKSVKQRKVWVHGLMTWGMCLLCSFVNPYGPRIWHEVWLSVSDTSLRWSVQEWMPVFFSFDIFYLFLAALSGVLIKKYSKIFTLEALGLNLFLFLQSFLSVRHVPLWLMIDLPMVFVALKEVYWEVKKIKFGEERLRKTLNFTLIIFFIFFISNFLLQMFGPGKFLSEDGYYPQSAVNYIKSNTPDGQVFSTYNWGGYLIWKLPEKKVFIDGRMPSWRWSGNKEGESNYIMKDYRNILKGKEDYKVHFLKYNIDTVLWEKSKKPSVFDNLEDKLLVLAMGKNYPGKKFNLVESLANDGWNKVYEDTVAVIYHKK